MPASQSCTGLLLIILAILRAPLKTVRISQNSGGTFPYLSSCLRFSLLAECAELLVLRIIRQSPLQWSIMHKRGARKQQI